jgi:hypothetical protein
MLATWKCSPPSLPFQKPNLITYSSFLELSRLHLPHAEKHTGLVIATLLRPPVTCCYQGLLPTKRKHEKYLFFLLLLLSLLPGMKSLQNGIVYLRVSFFKLPPFFHFIHISADFFHQIPLSNVLFKLHCFR